VREGRFPPADEQKYAPVTVYKHHCGYDQSPPGAILFVMLALGFEYIQTTLDGQ